MISTPASIELLTENAFSYGQIPRANSADYKSVTCMGHEVLKYVSGEDLWGKLDESYCSTGIFSGGSWKYYSKLYCISLI